MQNRAGKTVIDKREILGSRVPHDELADFFLQGHTSKQIGYAFFHAEGWVQISGFGIGHDKTPKRKIDLIKSW
jgi:hypothetical protein